MGCIFQRLQRALRCRENAAIWAEELAEVIALMEHNKFVKAFSEIQRIKVELELWAPDRMHDEDMETMARGINEDAENA